MENASRLLPLDILLAAMHARWEAGDQVGAVALARVAAPYLHHRRGSVPHGAAGFDPERLNDEQLLLLLEGEAGGERVGVAGAAPG